MRAVAQLVERSSSIIVAVIREITSAPNGCCALSIELTAAGCPVSRSSSVATTVVVPRSKAIAWRRAVVSPGSTSSSRSSKSTAVTFQSASRSVPPSDRSRSIGTRSSTSSIASQHALEVGGLVLERRLGQLEVALLHGRAQDHVPPDADERRLRPRLQQRHRDDEILLGRRAAGEPPARLQLVDRERARVDRRERLLPGRDAHLALLARAVAAAGRVDRDAVPARAVEERRARGDARFLDRAVGLLEDEPDAIRMDLLDRGSVAHCQLAAPRRPSRTSALPAPASLRRLRQPPASAVRGDPRRAPLVVAEQEVGCAHAPRRSPPSARP